MNDNEPDRLKDTRLDADISVLGDDHGGEPKVARLGGAPAPTSESGLRQAVKPEGEGPDTSDDDRTRDELNQRRAEIEAQRDVVDSYVKG